VGVRSFHYRIIRRAALRLTRRFARAQDGAIAVVFAVLLIPMIIGVGVAVDYMRAYNAHSEMQAELDVALVAAIKSIDKVNKKKIEGIIEDWFSTQTRITQYKIDNVVVDTSNSTITATAFARIPTTFLQVGGIEKVDVAVTSQIAGPASSFLDVYLVLDKSASMMLAATTAGQQTMRAGVSCEFACHGADGGPINVNGKTYANNYDFSVAAGVKLRSDVLLAAVDRVIDAADAVDPSGDHIRIGLYKLGDTLTEVMAPTPSAPKAKTALHDPSNGLTSASQIDHTFFDVALPKLATTVGTAGDGKSASKAQKLVMMVTDGVESERPWVWDNSTRTSPLNPAWCDAVKNKGATFATIYTTYLPITFDGGYNATVGNTMASSEFTTTWGGKMRAGVSGTTTRRDYLPMALEDCATSSAYFMQATEAGEIEGSLEEMFKRYMTSVRLTK
jgi:Flp pilus assembly protein TadG